MSSPPLVSVIMATYNGAVFVAESIESVLAQTYSPVELVVVDDCSTDGTADIVESYAKQHPDRIRLERKSDRLGPCRRRNDALDLARGELIAWLDQDDLWLPDKTEREAEVLMARPEVGLVYSGFEAFDSESGDTVPWRERDTEAEGDVLVPLFERGCFVASLTALFRREVLTRRQMRLRETDFSFGDDYHLWLVLSLDWQVALIDEVLARYRRHGQNESTRLGGTNFHLRRIELLREFVADFPEAKPRLGPWRRRGLARHYVRAARFEAASSRMRAVAPISRALVLAPSDTVRAIRGTGGHSRKR